MSERLLGEAGAAGGAAETTTPFGAGGAARRGDSGSSGSAGGDNAGNGGASGPGEDAGGEGGAALTKGRRRRRGSRGGRGRRGGGEGGPAGDGAGLSSSVSAPADDASSASSGAGTPAGGAPGGDEDKAAPDAAPTPVAAESGADDPAPPASNSAFPAGTTPVGPQGPAVVLDRATGQVRKPKIGDTLPGSPPVPRRRARREPAGSGDSPPEPAGSGDAPPEAGLEGPADGALWRADDEAETDGDDVEAGPAGSRQRRARRRKAAQEAPATSPGGRSKPSGTAVRSTGVAGDGGTPDRPNAPSEGLSTRAQGAPASSASRAPRLDLGEPRSRRDKRARPLGRYLMVVHVGPTATQIAVLEGRTLIEHYVSRPADDATQIDGNIYLGRVQNVLPGMEAAFVDIGTPKNAVLYRGDLRFDDDEVAPAGDDDAKPTRGHLAGAARDARIEQLLHTGQNIICQVTKNPIGTKGARLTQEVSLPGRFVVLIPDSDTYGISKRLPDDERRRLRKILDDIRPAGHGLIVRTAAEGASAEELDRDVARLLRQWESVRELAATSRAPQLLYREPDLAVRVIREEFNRDYRGVVIDDPKLYAEVKEYVTSITPDLADRVELVNPAEEPLPLFERFRVHEQVHKALDRKVWLPSGGSLIIERTEALTVIDVNTGKNVGTSNLEETVFRNNLEAAEEIARQLRLRDIGGIIVIDFIDMEVAANRAEVMTTFREALARDKTRTQVFEISELGLVEMTRKRISEGLVESYSETCPTCGGRGIIFDDSLLG